MWGIKSWGIVNVLLNYTTISQRHVPSLDLRLLRRTLEPSTYKLLKRVISTAISLDMACYHAHDKEVNVILLPRLYMDLMALMPSNLDGLLKMLGVEECAYSLKNFLSNYLWYILLWMEAVDALVYSRMPGMLLELLRAQTSLKSLRSKRTRSTAEAVEHAISMLHYFIKLDLRERLAKRLNIDVSELNKGYIYYTSILSTYFHEEVSRALQQHIAVRNLTPYEISESVKTSASRLLNEVSIREHERLAQERLSIVLAKLETYAPASKGEDE
jgi:hypothetical protein